MRGCLKQSRTNTILSLCLEIVHRRIFIWPQPLRRNYRQRPNCRYPVFCHKGPTLSFEAIYPVFQVIYQVFQGRPTLYLELTAILDESYGSPDKRGTGRASEKRDLAR